MCKPLRQDGDMTTTQTPNTNTRPDAWDIAFEVAYAAIARNRAEGIWDHAPVHQAVADSGISAKDFWEIAGYAIRSAFHAHDQA